MTDGVGRVRFGPEAFRFQRHGGVSRYVIEVHRGLLARGVDSRIVAGLHRSAMLDGVPEVKGIDVESFRPARLRQALTRAADAHVSRRVRAGLGPRDVWHPSYFAPIPRGRSAVVVTVYDMIHERYPDEMGPRDRTLAHKATACATADLVLCISEATAQDVVERLEISRDKVVVTHLGVRPAVPLARARPNGDRPYVLYVGDRRPTYKGWALLLEALAQGSTDLDLLCVGGRSTSEERGAVRAVGLDGRVLFEGGTDEALAGRYRDALGLVYPSRYEGFGLPPLEALAQGCAVVTTPVGAIPEVVGGIAILVEPTVAGIGDGIARLVAGGPEVLRQRADGPAHAARFPWQATADATLAAYERVVG